MRAQMLVITPTRSGVRVISRHVVSDRSGRSVVVDSTREGKLEAVTIEDGTWTKNYVVASKLVKIKRCLSDRRGPYAVERRERLIHRNYIVTLVGSTVFAGRRCDILRFTPRHHGAHNLQVWVDKPTGAELSRSESDVNGETFGVTMATSVSFPRHIRRSELTYPLPHSARKVNISRSRVLRDVALLRRLTKAHAIVPLVMPDGYQFECCTLTRINSAPTIVMRYSDGLAAITICQQPSPLGCPAGLRAAYPWTRGEVIMQYVAHNTLFMVIGHTEPVKAFPAAQSLDSDRDLCVIRDLARMHRIREADLRGLRDRGYGLREIVALAEARARSRASVADLERLLDAGYDWRDLAHRYGITEPVVMADVHALLAGVPIQR